VHNGRKEFYLWAELILAIKEERTVFCTPVESWTLISSVPCLSCTTTMCEYT
jgi:hypothetical protein